MADKKISEMTHDTSVGGSEKIPVSDGTNPKYLTTGEVKDYTIEQLLASDAVDNGATGDEILINRSDAAKVLDIDDLATYIANDIWGEDAVTSLADANLVPVSQAGTRAVVTLENFASYIADEIEADLLDASDLDDAAALSTSDYFIITQGSTAKKVTLDTVKTKIYDTLSTYVAALTAVTTSADSDVFYVIQGGVEKKVTLETLKDAFGDVAGPDTTTEGNIPEWNDTSGTLADGYSVQSEVRATGSAEATAVVTEAGIRSNLDSLIYDQSDIGAALADADLIMVDDGAAGTAQCKATLTRVWTWITGKIQGLTAKTTPVDADILTIQDSAASNALKELTVANLWDNRYLTDAKAIKLDDFSATDDNTDLNATTAKHGLCPKLGGGTTNYLRADGTWAEPPDTEWDGNITDMDIDGGTDIGADLVDADLIVVDDGAGGTNRKCAMSRVKTYAQGIKLDDFTSPDDNTDLNVSTSAHGLCPKLDNDTGNFLRGDGTWADPDGDAIHDNVAGEINAISEKASPIGADILLIEDSADSNNKKKVQITNLPTVVANGTPEQGDVLYWDGSDWQRLAHGTSGQFLRTNGDSSNPSWATPAGSGDVTGPVTNLDGTVPVFDGANSNTLADSGLLPEEMSFFYSAIYG